MFGVPGTKGIFSSPPQPWIRFNDSPPPSETSVTNHQQKQQQQYHHHHQLQQQHQQQQQQQQQTYNQSYQSGQVQQHLQFQQQQQQPHSDFYRQSKVSSLSPSLSDNFSPNDVSNNISSDIQLANFDFNAASLEKDPKVLHPVALRVSPEGQSMSCDSHSSGGSYHSDGPFSHKGLAHLSGGMDRQGAFSVYRKADQSNNTSIKKTKECNRWLEILKAKYHPPKPVQMPSRNIYDLFQNKELVDYIQDLQERCYRLETINNELIHKMANLMEDQSYHNIEYKRLSK